MDLMIQVVGLRDFVPQFLSQKHPQRSELTDCETYSRGKSFSALEDPTGMQGTTKTGSSHIYIYCDAIIGRLEPAY